MTYFVGILDGQGDVWGVRVPDLPGCHGGGPSPEAAIQDAISALAEMAEEARSVTPRDAAAIARDPSAEFNAAAGESFVMLPALYVTGVPTKANISLDKGQLAAIDAAAKARGLTRSTFIVSAAMEKIAAEG
jgi:predicted RNase H-like HicB family nuclease